MMRKEVVKESHLVRYETEINIQHMIVHLLVPTMWCIYVSCRSLFLFGGDSRFPRSSHSKRLRTLRQHETSDEELHEYRSVFQRPSMSKRATGNHQKFRIEVSG